MWHTPIVQGGGRVFPSSKSKLTLFVGRARRVSTQTPEMPMHERTIISFPASELKRCTNAIAVSQTLNRRFGENYIFSILFSNVSKNAAVLTGTNPLIRAAGVGSGFLNDSVALYLSMAVQPFVGP
jgi:hypothetical protein